MARDLRGNLQAHVSRLAGEIGSRGFADTEKLALTAEYIENAMREAGLEPRRQVFEYSGNEYANIICEVKGRRAEVFVVGAHYDTVTDTPGADDNASGVAGLLEMARLAATGETPVLTMRFAAFCLEEPPVFRSPKMGSNVYAESLKEEGAAVRGMISLEMIGYFSDAPGSQFYPMPAMRWIYPKRGNFIGFVGNIGSRDLTRKIKEAFKRHTDLRVESINTVKVVPGVDFSDHRSFWKHGYEAFMVTDTAFYRNPHYHTPGDLPETLDYERMAEVVLGLGGALRELDI